MAMPPRVTWLSLTRTAIRPVPCALDGVVVVPARDSAADDHAVSARLRASAVPADRPLSLRCHRRHSTFSSGGGGGFGSISALRFRPRVPPIAQRSQQSQTICPPRREPPVMPKAGTLSTDAKVYSKMRWRITSAFHFAPSGEILVGCDPSGETHDVSSQRQPVTMRAASSA